MTASIIGMRLSSVSSRKKKRALILTAFPLFLSSLVLGDAVVLFLGCGFFFFFCLISRPSNLYFWILTWMIKFVTKKCQVFFARAKIQTNFHFWLHQLQEFLPNFWDFFVLHDSRRGRKNIPHVVLTIICLTSGSYNQQEFVFPTT